MSIYLIVQSSKYRRHAIFVDDNVNYFLNFISVFICLFLFFIYFILYLFYFYFCILYIYFYYFYLFLNFNLYFYFIFYLFFILLYLFIYCLFWLWIPLVTSSESLSDIIMLCYFSNIIVWGGLMYTGCHIVTKLYHYLV